jgi:pyruvate/2-oxoglutarate dehydrogenase complex dihydrolipoamide dehydrogenase (E3) component
MKLLKVDVHLGVNVTPEMVLELNPDATVVATGAALFRPELPGADGDNVFEMRQVLQGEVEVGQNVIVADLQRHIYGLDTADFLAEKGKKVELVTEVAYAGMDLDYCTIEDAYYRLLTKRVVITPLTRVKEIRGNTVIVYNTLTNDERQIEGVDAVVFCHDGMPEDSLYRSLKGKVKELYELGQCVSPRKLLDSVYDAAVVGRLL